MLCTFVLFCRLPSLSPIFNLVPHHVGVLAVSRAFGNRTLKSVIRPDIEMIQRELSREDDFLVLASDGLWDVLRNKDVCDACYSMASSGSQHIAEELVNLALSRGSMDNVTCVVVRLKGYTGRLATKDPVGKKADHLAPTASDFIDGVITKGLLLNEDATGLHAGYRGGVLSAATNTSIHIPRADSGREVKSAHAGLSAPVVGQKDFPPLSQEGDRNHLSTNDDDEMTYVVAPSSSQTSSRSYNSSNRLLASLGLADQKPSNTMSSPIQTTGKRPSSSAINRTTAMPFLLNRSGSGFSLSTGSTSTIGSSVAANNEQPFMSTTNGNGGLVGRSLHSPIAFLSTPLGSTAMGSPSLPVGASAHQRMGILGQSGSVRKFFSRS